MTRVGALLPCVVLVLCCVSFSQQERRRFDGYEVLTVIPRDAEQLQAVQTLLEKPKITAYSDHVRVHRPTELLIAPEMVELVHKVVKALDIDYRLEQIDFQRFLDEQYARLDANVDYDPNDYNTYEEIMGELDRLLAVCPGDFVCEIRTYGSSIEGRDLKVFSIKADAGSERQSVWLDSLIHSREWLAGATVMRILAELVEGYGVNATTTDLLDNYDFLVAPVLNPDGYEYTFTEDRLWRKNRRIGDGTAECLFGNEPNGVDINRNFPYAWGEVPGSSHDICSDLYCGEAPASEPEISAYMAEVESHTQILTLITVHSFDWSWLTPYGAYDDEGVCKRPDNHDDIIRAGEACIAAIEEEGGDEWIVGSVCEALYTASGITVDYAKELGIKYVYTPELRGPGFTVGPEVIDVSFRENYAGLVALMNEIQLIENGE